MSAPVVVFVVCVAACVVAHGAILLSTVSARAGAQAMPGIPHPRLATEVFWALVPAVALAFVLTATWAHIRERETNRDPAPVTRVAQ